MPDTYISFVIGYGVLWVALFGLIGLSLKKVLHLEKQIDNVLSSIKSK